VCSSDLSMRMRKAGRASAEAKLRPFRPDRTNAGSDA
jgi:hypothetical protein